MGYNTHCTFSEGDCCVRVDRFRSITKQYFRKADGVIVVYDLLSEVSFKNVRSWMSSVKVKVAHRPPHARDLQILGRTGNYKKTWIPCIFGFYFDFTDSFILLFHFNDICKS